MLPRSPRSLTDRRGVRAAALAAHRHAARVRVFLIIASLLVMALPAPAAETGAMVHTRHAIAMFGEPKYPPNFRHFDYVNPDAPKGGLLRLGAAGTFDSFNPYIIKGNPAAGIGAETLTVASADEPFTRYGLIAETITWPDDRSWVEFTLRREARWHDGQPITVDDVIYSFEILKSKGAPEFRFYYRPIEKAERTGERSVRFTFNQAGNRELPLIAGEIPVLPKHYWESRDFERTTLEPPLLSGPYRIAAFEAGRFVLVERVADYWGRDLPVNRGTDNFDRIRTDYFRDETVLRQALKAGTLDFRVENQAKAWALDYDTPAVRAGWLIKKAFPHERPAGMQAFVLNTRRAVFADRRVREAINYAFDFEWTNRILFFDQYTRTKSYFANSELASSGLPEGEERAMLERYRDRLPAEVFEREFTVPETDGSGWPRQNLETALRLLQSAGWEVRDMRLVNATTGEPMRFEILIVQPAFERIILPFIRNLRRLGIDARLRLVDESQYINRIRAFDFDMTVLSWGQSHSPGNEQRNFWTSAAADSPGSRNWAGIKDPVVDDLVEAVITAPDRETLKARTHALDRVLLWGFYVIPNWHVNVDRVLYWDKFGYPETGKPLGALLDTWWFDAAKAERLAARATLPANGGAAEAETPARGPTPWLLALALVAIVAFAVLGRRRRDRRS
jgi:microcin C transport system substrate-binding protein